MICSTWFDKPLSVAGRLLIKDGNELKTQLINIDRDLVLIQIWLSYEQSDQ